MESTAIMEMGNRIKTLRLAKSMTQEQLARALHVSAQAVSKWELGGSLPDIQLLPALSVVLGTSIDALFSLTDESRLARIDNMLEDRRFLTQHEFETEERFLQEKCMEGSENVRAVLLLARLYCKRAGEYRALASPLARRALELDPQSKEAHTAAFAAENGAYPDWNVSNHSETIAFYKDFLARHPVAAQGIRAHQLGKIRAVVRGRHFLRLHLHERHMDAALRKLPCRLASGQARTDHLDFLHVCSFL